MKNFLIFCLFVCLIKIIHAQDTNYECRKDGNHIIHILTIKPEQFAISFVKARNQAIGRETVEAIAQKTGADIAINAGFFEIGHDQDGLPSGTLIINKQILGLNLSKHACLIYDQKSFKIQDVRPSLIVTIGKNTFTPKSVNKIPKKGDVILYSHLWGARTLTSLKDRQEIAIGDDFKVVEIAKQGNLAIPQNGFVLSLPISYSLKSLERGDEVTLQLDAFQFAKSDRISAVMGIPILIQQGTINPIVMNNKSTFYKSPHARTAFGIKANGDLVLVVCEHTYKRPLHEVALEDVKALLTKNKSKLMAKYQKPLLNNLTLTEMKEIVLEEFSDPNVTLGLTLPELANLLKELGCESAINLDGGGSSSLFYNNKTINQPCGDQDEGMGQSTLRPVSDAIVFKRSS
jgi:exopolysaccharide biosynthesis protein